MNTHRVTPSLQGVCRATLISAMITIVAAFFAPQDAQAAPIRTTADQRAKAATFATGKIGAPYRYGAAGPTSFDCSGLVGWAYRKAGKPLGVRTSQEMWRLGVKRTRAQLQKGDLVYTWDKNHGHVGIFIGQGKYVHAPGAGRRVQKAALPATGAGFYGGVRP